MSSNNKNLTKTQRDLISEFISITGAHTNTATNVLGQTRWSLERAVDYYYGNGLAAQAPARPQVNRGDIHKIFLKYKDESNDAILAEGIMQLCEDIGVEPEDVVMLILSWHLGAESMGEYSQSEFEGGFARLGVDSIDKLKEKLPQLRSELNNPSHFKQIYNYAYAFSRDKGHKCVQLDVALAVWQLLITPQRWKHIIDWCEYLKEHHKRAISKDTWSQLLEFMNTIESDFSNYDENGAWPFLLDEFVVWVKEKNAMNNGTDA